MPNGRRANGPARAIVLAGLFASAASLQGCVAPGELSPTGGIASAGQVRPAPADPEIARFYETRGSRPLWSDGARLRPEAEQLVALLRASDRDGLNPARYVTPELTRALSAARRGGASALNSADFLLSSVLVAYVRDLRRPVNASSIAVVDREVAPRPVSAAQLLDGAASAPSLGAYLTAIQRMNPVYEGLRAALARRPAGASLAEDGIIRANLERARMIPADVGRFVLVDTAGATLSLYEDGRVTDTMKVVVGRTETQTPDMAALIRFAVLNPVWNIPPDLVRDRVAPRVLREGLPTLAKSHFQVLSDFTDQAVPVRPSKVNWQAVAAGRQELKMRQLPGGDNMMGAVKFMFPNKLAIYLHDTPNRELFLESDRRRSSGCVRVEDARRLSRWLFGRTVKARGKAPEQRVDLPAPVPVFITYLTAMPTATGVQFRRDAYNRDARLLAQLAAARGTIARS